MRWSLKRLRILNVCLLANSLQPLGLGGWADYQKYECKDAVLWLSGGGVCSEQALSLPTPAC